MDLVVVVMPKTGNKAQVLFWGALKNSEVQASLTPIKLESLHVPFPSLELRKKTKPKLPR